MCICGQDMVQVVSIDHRNTAVSPVDSLKQLRERMREEREETMKLIHASECTWHVLYLQGRTSAITSLLLVFQFMVEMALVLYLL